MADRFSKEKRSEIMSKIRSKGTKPEMIVHNLLKGNRVRHKMWPKMEGNPDIMIFGETKNKKDVFIFVNGCFWHGCKIHFKLPKTHKNFWRNKIKNNAKRQRLSVKKLKKLGHCVIIIWEHDLH